MIHAALAFAALILQLAFLAGLAIVLRLRSGAVPLALAAAPTALLGLSAIEGGLAFATLDYAHVIRCTAWITAIFCISVLLLPGGVEAKRGTEGTARRGRALAFMAIGAPVVTLATSPALWPDDHRSLWTFLLVIVPVLASISVVCFGIGLRVEADLRARQARRRSKRTI